MKKVTVTVLAFVWIFLFCIPSAATQVDPYSVKENGDVIEEEISFKGITGQLFEGIKSAVSEKKNFLLQMLALMVFMYIVNALNEAYPSSDTVKTVTAVIMLAAGVVLYRNVYSSTYSAVESFSELSGFISSLAPTMAASLASGGFAETGTVGCTGLLISGQVCAVAAGSLMLPGINTYLSIGIASSVSGNNNLKNLSGSVRNAVIICIAFILCIFCGIMAVQTSIAIAGDGLTRRTVKFAAGSFVPMFGGAVSESLDSAFAAGQIMKNSIGITGIATVIATLCGPVCGILTDFAILSVCCIGTHFFDNISFRGFIETARDAYSILLSLAVSVAVMAITVISMMIKVV